MVKIDEGYLEERLKEKVIIRDLKNDEFSHHTTVEGIFSACANEFKKYLDENEIEIWDEDFSSYSILDKKNFVEVFF